jgi:hypothetical protein
VTGTSSAPAATKVEDLLDGLCASIRSAKSNRSAPSQSPTPVIRAATKRSASAQKTKSATPMRKTDKAAPKKAPARRKA